MLSKTQRSEKLLRHYRKCFPILVFPLQLVNPMILFFTYESTETLSKKHGGSDRTVIKRRQQKLGRMADFLPSVTFSIFDL